MKRIAVGADHGGYELKERIKAHLLSRGLAVEDCGTHSAAAVDYPVFARAVAERVAAGRADGGIVVDGAGIGSAMAANKVAGVRAAPCHDVSSARSSREHNDANVLTLGAGLIGPAVALQIVDVWLASNCTEERHRRRVGLIERHGAAAPSAPPAAAAAAVPAAPNAAQESRVDPLTDADIQRIMRRAAELAGSPTPGTATPAELACALCQICAEAHPELVRRLVELGADRIGHRAQAGVLPSDLAGYIDHTLLRPEATAAEVRQLCDEARQYGFASVCVNPTFVPLAAACLKNSAVRVCSVVGFPLGTHTPEIKALEARQAIRGGAREIDMVINVGALKGGDDEAVYRDIRAVTEACIDGRAICKVIIETALLTDDEKVRACKAARRARADFVKTSTGFGPSGATAHDVALMAEAVKGTAMGVKASGGIRSFDDALKMIQAGATRLGVSAGIKIIKEAGGLTVSGDGSGRY